MRQPQILLVTTSVTATLALIAYTLVALSLARARLRGEWAPAEPGYFTLSRLGTPITVAAVVWGATMIVNLAWPRKVFYNPVEPFHWYLQWGGVLIPTFLLTVGFLVYRFVQRHRIGILAAHAAAAPDARERHPASSPRTRESV